eukprot:Pompholyxophrys_punicea_v1_NODE_9_length_7618_cov_25.552288.p4 type:complete len:251 gc:universal NODE_9_length_7618_cov_25.552288:4808-4056(-)
MLSSFQHRQLEPLLNHLLQNKTKRDNNSNNNSNNNNNNNNNNHHLQSRALLAGAAASEKFEVQELTQSVKGTMTEFQRGNYVKSANNALKAGKIAKEDIKVSKGYYENIKDCFLYTFFERRGNSASAFTHVRTAVSSQILFMQALLPLFSLLDIVELVFGDASWLAMEDVRWAEVFQNATSFDSPLQSFLDEGEMTELLANITDATLQSTLHSFFTRWNNNMEAFNYNMSALNQPPPSLLFSGGDDNKFN